MSRKQYCSILLFFLSALWLTGKANQQDSIFSRKYKESISALYNRGNMFLKKGNKDSAMLYYMVCTSKNAEAANRKEQEMYANALNEIGKIYFSDGMYNQAMEYFIKGSIFCEKNGIKSLIPKFYNNIGTVYGIFQDSTSCAAYYIKSLELSENNGDVEQRIITLKNMSSFYYKQKNNMLGDKYNKELLSLAEYDNTINFNYYFGNSMREANSKNYGKAKEYIRQAIDYANRIKMQPVHSASAYSMLAEFYGYTGPADSMTYYTKKSLDIAEKNNITYIARSMANSLYTQYHEMGREEEAMKYKIKYWTITDSIFNNTEFNKIQNTRFYYELDSKSKELQQMNISMEMKEQQLHNARVRFITLLAASVLFVIFIFVLYRQKKKLHDTYKDLFGKNKELLKAEQESRRERSEFLSLLAHEREMNLLLLKQQTMNTTAKDEDSSEESPAEEEENTRLYSVDKISDDKKEIILRKINDVMENTKDFCDCGFTLDRLAKAVGSNARYVSHIIHETYNKSFPAYLNEYRIREAQIRLLDVENYGNYTIKAISESVGYKSLSGFISIFKSHTGMSPAIYQKMASEKQS